MRYIASLVPILALAGCAVSPPSESRGHATSPADELELASSQAPDCAALAAQLAELLAAARSCNVAAANPTQCASWVPSISGCSEPVAYAGSDATRKYLEVFELYAQSCPLPDPACVDPTTLAVDCTQAPGGTTLAGACTIR
jgi:hypothetical protein